MNKIKIGKKEFIVKIANTPEQLHKGLSGEKSLDKDHGMLFVFKEEGHPFMVMRDMLFPIDFLFIDKMGKVLDVKSGDVGSKERYSIEGPVKYVLEVNKGEGEGLIGKSMNGEAIQALEFGDEIDDDILEEESDADKEERENEQQEKEYKVASELISQMSNKKFIQDALTSNESVYDGNPLISGGKKTFNSFNVIDNGDSVTLIPKYTKSDKGTKNFSPVYSPKKYCEKTGNCITLSKEQASLFLKYFNKFIADNRGQKPEELPAYNMMEELGINAAYLGMQITDIPNKFQQWLNSDKMKEYKKGLYDDLRSEGYISMDYKDWDNTTTYFKRNSYFLQAFMLGMEIKDFNGRKEFPSMEYYDRPLFENKKQRLYNYFTGLHPRYIDDKDIDSSIKKYFSSNHISIFKNGGLTTNPSSALKVGDVKVAIKGQKVHLEPNSLYLLDKDGYVIYNIKGRERFFSKIDTKKLFDMALKCDTDEDCISFGKEIYNMIEKQNSNKDLFVKE